MLKELDRINDYLEKEEKEEGINIPISITNRYLKGEDVDRQDLFNRVLKAKGYVGRGRRKEDAGEDS